MQYEVLQPLSPARGLPILPAPEDAPPVILDEAALFADPSELSNAQRAAILIALGVIRPAASEPAPIVGDAGPEIVAVAGGMLPDGAMLRQSEPDAPEQVFPLDGAAPHVDEAPRRKRA